MIEFVIKVVENLADIEARVERINCFISLVERLGESSEHMGKGDVGFPVSVITRRIVDKRGALLVARCIAAPQVSMKKGGAWGVICEERGKVFQKPRTAGKALPFVPGQVKLVSESMIRIKKETQSSLRGLACGVAPMQLSLVQPK